MRQGVEYTIPSPKQQCRPLPSLLSLFYTSHANLSHQWCDVKGCFTYRKKDQLAEVLRHALDTSNNKYADIDEEDDFQVRNCCGKSNRSYTHAALTALNIASDLLRKTCPDEIASWQFINKRVSLCFGRRLSSENALRQLTDWYNIVYFWCSVNNNNKICKCLMWSRQLCMLFSFCDCHLIYNAKVDVIQMSL